MCKEHALVIVRPCDQSCGGNNDDRDVFLGWRAVQLSCACIRVLLCCDAAAVVVVVELGVRGEAFVGLLVVRSCHRSSVAELY